MVGIRPKDKEGMITRPGKSKTFRTDSTITTEAGDGGQQSKESTEKKACHSAVPVTELKLPPVDLGDLMLKLEQKDKKLKSGKEDREEMTREVRYKKN